LPAISPLSTKKKKFRIIKKKRIRIRKAKSTEPMGFLRTPVINYSKLNKVNRKRSRSKRTLIRDRSVPLTQPGKLPKIAEHQEKEP